MNQWLVIFLGALTVALIVIGLAAAYTTATAAKLPEQGEIIHLFLAGSIAGGILSWVISNGYLHGYSLVSMVASDVKSLAKEVSSLKGGEEVLATTDSSSSVQQMVGGFFNSIGLNSESLQELTVGMPTF